MTEQEIQHNLKVVNKYKTGVLHNEI